MAHKILIVGYKPNSSLQEQLGSSPNFVEAYRIAKEYRIAYKGEYERIDVVIAPRRGVYENREND